MADVTDRAQLILVTALVLALTLVALTLLLNTVIYTDNLASRGIDTEGRDAVTFQDSVSADIGDLIDEENRRAHGSHGSVEENVTSGLEPLETIYTLRYAEHASIVEVNASSFKTSNGTLVRQTNSTRSLTNESDESDWTITTDVDDTRGFIMTLENSTLISTSASQAETDGAFYINVTSPGQEWRAYVYENETNSEVAIAIDNGTGATEICSVDRSLVRVDLTGGTLGAEPCSGLDWTNSIANDYDISFVNGDNAEGRYDLTVNTSGTGSVNESNLNDGTSVQDSPYYLPAIYSATVDIRIQNAELRYEATIRIARGESK